MIKIKPIIALTVFILIATGCSTTSHQNQSLNKNSYKATGKRVVENLPNQIEDYTLGGYQIFEDEQPGLGTGVFWANASNHRATFYFYGAGVVVPKTVIEASFTHLFAAEYNHLLDAIKVNYENPVILQNDDRGKFIFSETGIIAVNAGFQHQSSRGTFQEYLVMWVSNGLIWKIRFTQPVTENTQLPVDFIDGVMTLARKARDK